MSQTKDIRDAVESELGYDPLVDNSDISVKNINGDVALNGTVPGYPQYLEAATAARRVAGVKKLQNHLEVVLPSTDYRDDAMLTTTANDALTLNVAVPDGVEATADNGNLTLTGTVRYGSEVAVDTSGNTVTLTGHVRTWAEHDAVIDAAWMPTGVYDVIDSLDVTG